MAYGMLSQGTALDDILRAMNGAQTENNQGLLTTGSQPLLSQPLGNKRDSVPLAQRSQTALPDLTQQQYKPKGLMERIKGASPSTPDMGLLRVGAAILGGKNFAQGLAAGGTAYADNVDQERKQFDASEQDRVQGLVQQAQLQQGQERNDLAQQQYTDDAPMRKLQLQELQQKLASGEVVSLGGGRFWDKSKRGQPGEFFNDPGFAAQQAAVAGAEQSARTANQGESWTPRGPVKGPDGKELGEGYTDGKSPTIYVTGPDGKPVAAPPGSTEVGTGYNQNLSTHQFYQLQDTLTSEENAAKLLNQYSKTAGSLDGGYKGLAENWTANVKTALGQGLTDSEIKRRIATGELQGLVGLLRLDVLGPGVVTDQDALRFYQRLGGNINNIFTHPEVVKQLTQELLQQKLATYQQHVEQYNREAQMRGQPLRTALQLEGDKPPATDGTTGTTGTTGKTSGGVTFTYTP
jgi:hypothetical protein